MILFGKYFWYMCLSNFKVELFYVIINLIVEFRSFLIKLIQYERIIFMFLDLFRFVCWVEIENLFYLRDVFFRKVGIS